MFGWTEIFITYSQDDYFKVRAQLDAAGISARSRVRGTGAQSGIGDRLNRNLEYRLFVRSREAERARHVIGRCR